MGGAQRVDDLHGLHLEGRAAVLAEHRTQRVENDARLGQVRRGALYEHVARRQRDLRWPEQARGTAQRQMRAPLSHCAPDRHHTLLPARMQDRMRTYRSVSLYKAALACAQ